MKSTKSILTLFLAAGVSLSGLAFGEYPAARFEPYIVYQAPEIVGSTVAESENDFGEKVSEVSVSVVKEKDPYPAASFQPVIVYQAEEVITAQERQPEVENVPAVAAVTEESGVSPTIMIVILVLLAWVVLQFRSSATTVIDEEPVTEPDPEKEVIEEIKSLAASIGAEVEITLGKR